MKILVACEESQTVTKEFHKKGHEVFSCDILPCSGGLPECHIQSDVRQYLDYDWDMILAFPPCDHLASSGARWFKQKKADGRQQQGIDFFMLFANHPCPKIAIENPVGIMSSEFRKPDQIIQPYQFGHDASKRTCLWLKGLPLLKQTEYVEPKYGCACGKRFNFFTETQLHLCQKGGKIRKIGGNQTPSGQNKLGPSKDRAKIRSQTYKGIAKAMADQWG